MTQYTIKKVSGAPDWSKIETLNMTHKYFETPAHTSAYAQICYDDERIYVHLSSTEPEVRAVETDVLGSPCEDSCLEFFFCPMENDNRYFNIEYNLNKCLYLGFGSGIADLVRLVRPDRSNYNDLLSPETIRTETGWEIFYSVPFEFIRRFFKDFEVYSGKRIKANCYKCGDLQKHENYLAWSPIVGEPFKFHRPECFGTMIFE